MYASSQVITHLALSIVHMDDRVVENTRSNILKAA